MDFEKLIQRREAFSEKGQGALESKVKALQGALYSLLLEKIVANLETDESGAIKFTISNIRTAGQLTTVWAAHQKSSNVFVKWIVVKLIELFDLNTLYARSVANVAESQEVKAKRLLLFNIGFDTEIGEIIEGSWLQRLAAQDEIKQKIANRIATAIQSKISLKKFREDFRDDFLNSKTGLGYLERYYEQRTFDLFQKWDRSVQQVYATELKLNWRIYSGTLLEPVKGKTKGSRPFCRQRINNIYSTPEIEKWRNLKFAGRVDPYDPFLDCGSIQCRHHWSVISDEMKSTLEKRGRKVDEYNPLPAGQTLTKY